MQMDPCYHPKDGVSPKHFWSGDKREEVMRPPAVQKAMMAGLPLASIPKRPCAPSSFASSPSDPVPEIKAEDVAVDDERHGKLQGKRLEEATPEQLNKLAMELNRRMNEMRKGGSRVEVGVGV
jgi:hypothetical protein